MPKILVIIPTYNEESNILRLLDKLLKLPLRLDILVVDDGDDQTANLLSRRQTSEPRLFFIKRQGKLGRGSAVVEGIKFGLAHDYDFLVEMDADFSHDPEELPNFINLASPNRVVIASRYLKTSQILNWPTRRRIISRLANWYARAILRVPLHDYTNGYRVYGREALKKIDFAKIQFRGFIVLSEIVYQLYQQGVEFREQKTVFVNRKQGASSFSFREISEAFWAIWKIRMQK